MARPYIPPSGHYGVTGRPYWIDHYGRYTTENPNGENKMSTTKYALAHKKVKKPEEIKPTLTTSSFRCTEGNVRFSLANIPGCCGISVLTGISFYPAKGGKKGKEQLYDAFQTALLSQYNDAYNWRVGKLIMSDTTKPEGTTQPSMWDFCKYADWYHATPKANPKTGRDLLLFEMDRDAKQDNGNPGYRAGGVGRDWWKTAA